MRFKVIRSRRKTQLDYLPPEVLVMITDLVTPQDVQSVQNGMGTYMGDACWRSSIPSKLIEALPLDGEELDWQYLCLEFERVGDRYWHQMLRGRRYLLGQLDKLSTFLWQHTSWP